MNRVSYIYHQGRQILFLDFTNCSVDEALGIIQEAGPIIREEHENSVLTLTDVTGARYNQEVTQAMKEFAKGNKPFVKAGAVVGLDGMKKVKCGLLLGGRKNSDCSTRCMLVRNGALMSDLS